MTTHEKVIIVDADAREGVAQPQDLLDPQAAHIRVHLADGGTFLVDKSLLQEGGEGRYRLPVRYAELQQAVRDGDDRPIVIPVIEEMMTVEKRVVTRGVRVVKSVEERQVMVDETFAEEDVEVERVQVDREVDGPVAIRYEGDTIIIPLLEEVVVVEKRLRLREEVRIRRRRTARALTEPVTLRREEVRVERGQPTSDHSGEQASTGTRTEQ